MTDCINVYIQNRINDLATRAVTKLLVVHCGSRLVIIGLGDLDGRLLRGTKGDGPISKPSIKKEIFLYMQLC
jgi:hypothetical protein